MTSPSERSARHPVFLAYNRKPVHDPNASVLTSEERELVERAMRDGTTPRFGLVRKAIRLSDERKLKLDRIQCVIDQARIAPYRYQGPMLAGIVHNLLSDNDDMGEP